MVEDLDVFSNVGLNFVKHNCLTKTMKVQQHQHFQSSGTNKETSEKPSGQYPHS